MTWSVQQPLCREPVSILSDQQERKKTKDRGEKLTAGIRIQT